MAFARLTLALLLFQLSLLSSITVNGIAPAKAPKPSHNHHHSPAPSPIHTPIKPPTHAPVHPPIKPPVKPPVHPPVKPPTKPPVHPPIKPPVKPPVHPPVKPPTHAPVHPPIKPPVKPPVKPPTRQIVGIRGMVYCKPCKYRGVDTLTAATPISGAVVQLKCKNTKYTIAQNTTTNKGFYMFTPKTVTTFGIHKCSVTIVASRLTNCSHPTNLNGGVRGAIPFPTPLPPVNHKPPLFALYSLQPFAFEPSKKLPCKK